MVITDDSDLIVYGCRQIIYKLAKNGDCMLFESSRLDKLPFFESYSFNKFQTFCILAGCDYFKLPNTRGKTALKHMKTYYKNNKLSIRPLLFKLNVKENMIDEYERKFYKAMLAFQLHVVYCPFAKTTTMLTPPEALDDTLIDKYWSLDDRKFHGELFSPDTSLKIAQCIISPLTLEPFQPIYSLKKN